LLLKAPSPRALRRLRWSC